MSVSLDNFDPTTKEGDPLDSPKSIEACLRLGITPLDLYHKTPEEYE